MIPQLMIGLILGTASAEGPPAQKFVFEKGNLRVESDVFQGRIGTGKEQTIGQFQGKVVLTLQDEARKLLLQAATITVGLDLKSDTPVQVATARGEVHLEVDLKEAQSDRVQHLVADSPWVIYEGREEKVIIQSPATVTMSSSTPEGGATTLQMVPRKKFVFWLQSMPEKESQEILSELEKAAGAAVGDGEKEASGGGT